jgi:hypothetical protein
MGTLLLHHPYVQFYLVSVGALLSVCLWDRLRPQPGNKKTVNHG